MTAHILNADTARFEAWRRGGWAALTLDERAQFELVRRRLEAQADEAENAGDSNTAARRREAAQAIRQGLATVTVIVEAANV